LLLSRDFKDRITGTISANLSAIDLQILQVNLGYLCNMACKHCHVGAGPSRQEVMEEETVRQVISVLERESVKTLDITGGAPEMNPSFRHLVKEAKRMGCRVIVRTNLTIFYEEGFDWVPEFYRENDLEVVASLPYYLGTDVDRVRGSGTFNKSIDALRELNSSGYGMEGTDSVLNLVYNPAGAFLAPSQEQLEADYKKELLERFGISFTRLYAFSNMPIGRFRDYLERSSQLNTYMDRLIQAFNPGTLEGLMCRHLISVGWDGSLYDCDFNQVLSLKIHDSCPQQIKDYDYGMIARRPITVGDHCYGCTAGRGST
jgi:radical SAM/Cys-rich protein